MWLPLFWGAPCPPAGYRIVATAVIVRAVEERVPMSLGLPTHLAKAANSRALASAATWAALVCLAAALVTVVASSFGAAGPYSWVTLVALMPMVAPLVLLARVRTVLLTVASLFVGALCTYFYVLTLLTQTPSYHDTNLFVVALPVV